MTLSFMQAAEEDLDYFIQVHHTTYRDTVEKMFGWDEALQNRIVAEKFDPAGIKIILYNQRRVGVVGWEDRGDHIWLKELFVLPAEQGQGIGTAVIQHVKRIASARNIDTRLRTLKASLRAKKLYERNGFVVSARTDRHWNMTAI